MSVSFGQRISDWGRSGLYGVQQAIKVSTQVVSSTDILNKTSKAVMQSFVLLEKTFRVELPKYAQEIGGLLKEATPYFTCVDFANRIYFFAASAAESSWQKIASMVCITFAQFISVMKFLDRMAVVNFTRVTLAIGGEKVMGLVGSILGLSGSVLGLWSDSRDIAEGPQKHQNAVDRRTYWLNKKAELLLKNADNSWAHYGTTSAWLHSLWRNRGNAPAEVGEAVLPLIGNQAFFQNSYAQSLNKINRKIEKWTVNRTNLTQNRAKAIVSLVENIAKVILGVIGLAFVFTGASCLAPLSLPLLSAGLALTLYGIGKSIYHANISKLAKPKQINDEKLFKTAIRLPAPPDAAPAPIPDPV